MLHMWTLVSGGPKTIWVKTDECRLENGERAFVDEFGDPPLLPEWYTDFPGSMLRDTCDARTGGERLWKHFSTRASAGEIVDYYLGQVNAGGLGLESEEFGRERMCPGFSSENDIYRFSIDVYERGETSFWTTGLETTGYEQTKWIPGYLQYLSEGNGQIHLRENRMFGLPAKDCWAPLEAFRDTQPPDERKSPSDTQQILWSSLPGWFQFDLTKGHRARVYLSDEPDGSESWIASLFVEVDTLPHVAFARSLDAIESHGFDGSGNRSSSLRYFISSLYRGRWLSAQIQSESSNSASFGVSEAGDVWKAHFSFSPPKGTPPPAFVEWDE